MPEFHIVLEPAASALFERIAEQATLPTEQVLSDALFRLAGELSVEALNKKHGN